VSGRSGENRGPHLGASLKFARLRVTANGPGDPATRREKPGAGRDDADGQHVHHDPGEVLTAQRADGTQQGRLPASLASSGQPASD